jgi:hypothetical protein
MKRKDKLRGITFFLAISAGVFSSSFCVLLMAEEYQSARYELDRYNLEFQGWEACQQTKPAYFKDNAEAVSSCLKSLDQARSNFWVQLTILQLAGLFVLAGLSSAIGGFLAAWLVFWFSGLCIYRFISWMGLCFRRHSERKKLLALRIAEEVAKRKETQRHLSNKKAVYSEWKLVSTVKK